MDIDLYSTYNNLISPLPTKTSCCTGASRWLHCKIMRIVYFFKHCVWLNNQAIKGLLISDKLWLLNPSKNSSIDKTKISAFLVLAKKLQKRGCDPLSEEEREKLNKKKEKDQQDANLKHSSESLKSSPFETDIEVIEQPFEKKSASTCKLEDALNQLIFSFNEEFFLELTKYNDSLKSYYQPFQKLSEDFYFAKNSQMQTLKALSAPNHVIPQFPAKCEIHSEDLTTSLNSLISNWKQTSSSTENLSCLKTTLYEALKTLNKCKTKIADTVNDPTIGCFERYQKNFLPKTDFPAITNSIIKLQTAIEKPLLFLRNVLSVHKLCRTLLTELIIDDFMKILSEITVFDFTDNMRSAYAGEIATKDINENFWSFELYEHFFGYDYGKENSPIEYRLTNRKKSLDISLDLTAEEAAPIIKAIEKLKNEKR